MIDFMDKSSNFRWTRFLKHIYNLALGAFNKEKAFSEYCEKVREISLTAL